MYIITRVIPLVNIILVPFFILVCLLTVFTHIILILT